MEMMDRVQVGVEFAVAGRSFPDWDSAVEYAESINEPVVVEIPIFEHVEQSERDEIDPGPPTCPAHGPVGALVDGKCRQCLGLREREADGRPGVDPVKVAYVLLEALSSSTGIGTVGYIIGGLTYHLPADLREQVQAAWSDALDRWYGAPVEG